MLQPQSLKLVTFWHFCVKAQRRGFHKTFVTFLAAGYCFIPLACAVEGQVCVGKRHYGTAGHIHSHVSVYVSIKKTNKLIMFFLVPFFLEFLHVQYLFQINNLPKEASFSKCCYFL